MGRNAHIRIIYLPQQVAYIISWCGLCLLHTVGSPELLAIREPQQDNKPKYPHLFFICGKNKKVKSLLPGIEWHIRLFYMRLLKVNIISIIFLAVATSGFAQTKINSVCRNIDGYWGDWIPTLGYEYELPRIKGTYANFVIYPASKHPSDYCVKVDIYNFNDRVDKKEKKRRIKEKQFYEYSGSIEFYLNDYYVPTTVRDWVAHWNGKMPTKYSHDGHTGKAAKRVVYPAKILIAPYKDKPKCYNIIFSEYGIAFTFN